MSNDYSTAQIKSSCGTDIAVYVIISNYSMSARWIRDDSERGAYHRLGYNHLVSNKRKWNKCLITNDTKM